MKLLNTLQAAPGQRNRALVTDFLVFKRWIKHGQEPEAWPVRFMPEFGKMAALVEELAGFEQMRREQNKEIVL